MVKPRPTILAKARPINLVMRSPRCEKDSSQRLEYLVNPGNADERKEVGIALETVGDPPKIFQFLQKKLGTTEGYSTFSMEASKTNMLIWEMFMSSSMKAAIHLGPNYLANLEVCKNTNFEEIESIFNITEKWIMEHSEEILNVKRLVSSSASWTRSTLDNDQAVKWARSKVFVDADSVLCLGQMNDSKEALARWEGQVEGLKMYPFDQEAVGIDGEAIELEWNIFPGFSSLAILQEIQQDLVRKNIKPDEFKDWFIFMSMFIDIDWSKRKNDENCFLNAVKVKEYAMKFSQGHWTFLGLGSEEKWYG